MARENFVNQTSLYNDDYFKILTFDDSVGLGLTNNVRHLFRGDVELTLPITAAEITNLGTNAFDLVGAEYGSTYTIVLKNGNYIVLENTNTSSNYIKNVTITLFLKDGTQIAGKAGYRITPPIINQVRNTSVVYLTFLVDEERKGACMVAVFSYKTSVSDGYAYSLGDYNNSINVGSDGFFDKDTSGVRILYDFLNGAVTDSTDDYAEAGESGTGGGGGNFDDSSDTIDFPSLPTLSAADTGFIKLFNPSSAELKALASFMWSDDFYDKIVKLWADPINVVLGLSIVPVDVPSGGSSPVTVGNVSTGVNMTTAVSQYVTVDCGSINVNEYWGAYLDYAPYTSLSIYLPYCGIHPLNINECMGKSVHVMYYVDILSGSCVAFIKCGDSIMYAFQGQCSANIPITGDNFARQIQGAISIAGSVGSMVASGGMTAPLAIGEIASAASTVAASAPEVEKSGAIGSSGGLMSVQYPYLILTRPKQCLPTDQNKYIGYPAFVTKKIGVLTGYAEIELARATKLSCTDAEKNEIIDLLAKGVIL